MKNEGVPMIAVARHGYDPTDMTPLDAQRLLGALRRRNITRRPN